ncbi:30S ribosomal protein S20 [endosymbiont of Sipalinus gigas]|uniref:30S ribosomal protein S20 n=1 Tax=endosymbiont of Sipalinus gigas TaxID=1972134 RepID=UPI000DC71CC6|nr:30S ribosomal protein S20 [endosymbiont of Sipalinus gigas]BBA85348.1 30S ribosomal protein S20 [endosymbiont of Sipalinus gigas]
MNNKCIEVKKNNFKSKKIIKTLIKKTKLSIETKNKNLSIENFKKLQSYLDIQTKKNIIKKNKCSRYKSKLMIKINSI